MENSIIKEVKRYYTPKHFETIKALLMYAVKEYDDFPFFEHREQKLTYRQTVAAILCVMKRLEVNSGKYVLVDIECPCDFAVGFLAAVLCGKIAVLHNTTLPSLEVPFQHLDYACIVNKEFIYEIFGKDTVLNCAGDFAESTDGVLEALSMIPDTCPCDTCAVLCSSGTTSVPKGICLSQTDIIVTCENTITIDCPIVGRRSIALAPFYHVLGLADDLFCSVFVGGTLCLIDSPMQFFSALTQYNPHKVTAPPAIVKQLAVMLEHSDSKESVLGHNFKAIVTGGAPLDSIVMRKLAQYGVRVAVGYGQTECGCISMNIDSYGKPGSSGRLLNGVKVKIADDGEILVRAGNVMNGYLNDEQATKEVIVDGWLHTADLGYLDEDGFLYVTGRKNNLAIFEDGTKFPLESVEALLGTFDYVVECLARQSKNTWEITVYTGGVALTQEQKREIGKLITLETKHVISVLTESATPLPRNHTGKLIRSTSHLVFDKHNASFQHIVQ